MSSSFDFHKANEELKDLSEKELKYELFRAIRRHESERAIAILKQDKADPNWRHAYEGWSVLLHSYMEDDPLVFNYLLSRDDLDVAIADDQGHDIFYWMRCGGNDKKIDYKARLIEVKGSIGQKLLQLAEEKIRLLEAKVDELRHDNFQNDPLSLNIGSRYLLRVTHGPLKQGEIVTYSGTHTEPGERGHDTFDDFTTAGGKVLSIYMQVSTVKDSLNIFLDVEDDFIKYPERIRPLIKRLEYRSREVRSKAAACVQSSLHDYQDIVPILLKHAVRERCENEFLNALWRVRHEALGLVESFENKPATGKPWGYEWVLSRMGSTKHLAYYHQMLKSDEFMLVRHGIRHLVNIGDATSLAYLEAIKDHSNFNVRSDVEVALSTFKKS